MVGGFYYIKYMQKPPKMPNATEQQKVDTEH